MVSIIFYILFKSFFIGLHYSETIQALGFFLNGQWNKETNYTKLNIYDGIVTLIVRL